MTASHIEWGDLPQRILFHRTLDPWTEEELDYACESLYKKVTSDREDRGGWKGGSPVPEYDTAVYNVEKRDDPPTYEEVIQEQKVVPRRHLRTPHPDGPLSRKLEAHQDASQQQRNPQGSDKDRSETADVDQLSDELSDFLALNDPMTIYSAAGVGFLPTFAEKERNVLASRRRLWQSCHLRQTAFRG